jgi:hypothetical protein
MIVPALIVSAYVCLGLKMVNLMALINHFIDINLILRRDKNENYR